MIFQLILVVVALAGSEAAYNSTLGLCGYEATCSVSGYEGACVNVSSGCCDSGVVTSGLCPGSSDIKCCTQNKCSTPSGSGSCMQTSLCAAYGGNSYAGYCSGPDDLQCCVTPVTTCSTPYGSGTCIQTTLCSSQGGVSYPGYCPGASDIQCCVASGPQDPCSTPLGSGSCMATSQCSAQGGTSVPGYCPGSSDNQCCVSGVPTSGQYGFDISTTLSSSSASCLRSSGMSFTIPRGYMSVGKVDSAVCTSLISAANAGITTRDVYLFPCPTCSKSATTQMGELVDYLNSNCPSYWSGRVWLDIEGLQYWLGSYSSNQNWYKQLKDSCGFYGIRCGVYSSTVQWQAIFGSSSFVYGNELPIW
jgi:hypothetical protein